jgi:hypothetical protein
MKNFALVYLVDNDPTGQLMDVGDDPCFTSPPTWGICRPDIRNSNDLSKDSRLLFIARVREKDSMKYYIKGYFRVQSKVNVVNAFNRFKNRKNVIISDFVRTQPEIFNDDNIKAMFSVSGLPEFLTQIEYQGKVFYHKSIDDHAVDNWKCRRIYNCKKSSLANCLKKNKCTKESQNFDLKENYIIGYFNDYKDWNKFRIEWCEIAELISKPVSLKIPKGNRHPEIELSNEEFDLIVKHMNNKGSCSQDIN